jgi:uroporphyrinogen-III synthase
MTPRVLITRDATKAKALVQALQDYGFEASVVPVTKTVYLHKENELPEPEEFNWVAFTSATAVEAFAMAMEDSNRTLSQRPKLAAVGQATAFAVCQRLRDPHLVSAQGGGVELADALLEEEKGNTDWSVLWPCAQEPLPEFPRRLEAAGVTVEPWACYATEPVPVEELREELKEAAPWQAAVFAAPSAVRAFSEAWDEEWDFSSVAIGESTASALKSAGESCVYVSGGTGTADLLSAVIAALENKVLPAQGL